MGVEKFSKIYITSLKIQEDYFSEMEWLLANTHGRHAISLSSEPVAISLSSGYLFGLFRVPVLMTSFSSVDHLFFPAAKVIILSQL